MGALEVSDYYQVGLSQKQTDLDSWAKANGKDSVITLPSAGLFEQFEPLNQRLADEVFGPGSWDMVKKA